MDNTEIKLNLIIKKLNRLETVFEVLIKNHYPDLNLDLDHDHPINNNSDQDHDHDLSDEDLINWFKIFIQDNGISPEGRDFTPIVRNIKYFKSKFDTLTNPVKYALRFLPVPKIKPTPSLAEDDSLIYGVDRKLVESNTDKLTPALVKQLQESDPDLKKMSTLFGHPNKSSLVKNVFTAKAIINKLIQT